MESLARREKIRIRVLNSCEEGEHFHQDIELLYILEGTMDVLLGDERTYLQPDDILVINANKKHTIRVSENILYAKVSVEYHLVSDIFQSENIVFWCDSTREDNECYDELRDALKKLLNHYLNRQGGIVYFGHISLCYRILDLLSIHFLVQSSDKIQWDRQDQFEARIFQINNYMRANYNQPISLKDLSEKLYLSNSYLSRFFKKHYGMSFSEYLANIRLYHAVDELMNTNIPITKVAFNNGFASVTVFNQAFKKAFGETPSAYRKNSAEQKTSEEQVENLRIVEERLEHFLSDQHSGEEQTDEAGTLCVSHTVRETVGLHPVWNRMMNIGAAEELLRSEIREHVLLLKEALGFRYIRFWNVFSKQLLIDITCENGAYNFTRLDAVFDFLVQHGMKPHIELGQKPKRIHRNIQNILLKQMPTSEFREREQWNRLLDAWLSHLIHRYGRQEVDTWRMELWFDEGKRKKEDAIVEYLDLFQDTARIVRSYSSGIRLGGCGIRDDFKERLGADFLRRWGEQQYQPDYLSIICFAYVRGEIEQDEYSKRNTDNEGLKHWVLNFRQLQKDSGMEQIPLYITEWNLTISDRNYINDSCFKGAYMIKNVLDICDEAEELAYFTATDRLSEYYDSNALLHGGSGLLTKDGIFKPVAFAIDFLNRLYPERIARGSNYLITTDSHDTYGIVCHNQKKLNYNYYFTNEDELDKSAMWKYFEDRNALNLRITLSDMEDGIYQMKIWHANEQNGNILGLWGEMEYDSVLSREEIKYFRRTCEPRLTMQKVEVSGGICLVKVKLEANEMVYIDLHRMA